MQPQLLDASTQGGPVEPTSSTSTFTQSGSSGTEAMLGGSRDDQPQLDVVRTATYLKQDLAGAAYGTAAACVTMYKISYEFSLMNYCTVTSIERGPLTVTDFGAFIAMSAGVGGLTNMFVKYAYKKGNSAIISLMEAGALIGTAALVNPKVNVLCPQKPI